MRLLSLFGSKAAALLTVLLLVGAAGAQEPRPAAPATVPQIHKMTIMNGTATTVRYTVQGWSPHLQALVKTLEYTENELTLTTQLQSLRSGIVANEQALAAFQTWQQLGLAPSGYARCYAPSDTALKSALVPGLAQESTPASAFALINLWEQVQTELQAEQNRAAAAANVAPPAKQNAQPAAPQAKPPVAAPMAMP
jgi:hypothetical protein